MFDGIIKAVAQIFFFIYQNLSGENYGVALILFTLLTRILMIPLQIKQIKGNIMMQRIQPEIAHLQKKYGNDKERLQQEQMKLYNAKGYNPMSGCLPLLIQLPIILLLFQVINKPLTYIFNWSAEAVAEAAERLGLNATEAYAQVKIVYADKIMNMDFLGMKLGEIPVISPAKLFGEEWNIWLPIFLLAIITAVFSFFTTKITQKITSSFAGNTQQVKKKDETAGTMSMMMYLMPLMTLFISFRVPAALSFYWFISNILQTVIQIGVTKIMYMKDAQSNPVAVADKVKTIDTDSPEIIEVETDGSTDSDKSDK